MSASLGTGKLDIDDDKRRNVKLNIVFAFLILFDISPFCLIDARIFEHHEAAWLLGHIRGSPAVSTMNLTTSSPLKF